MIAIILLSAFASYGFGSAAPGRAPGVCPQDVAAAWKNVQSMVRQRVQRFEILDPFARTSADRRAADDIQFQLKHSIGLDGDYLFSEDAVSGHTDCAMGAMSLRMLLILARHSEMQLASVRVEIVKLVLRFPWVEVLLSGWPMFQMMATMVWWMRHHVEIHQLSADVGFESICDKQERGATVAARRYLGRHWRGQDQSPSSLAAVVENALTAENPENDVLELNSAQIRVTQLHGLTMRGGMGVTFNRTDLGEAVTACARSDDCAGVTGKGDESRLELSKGDPFLVESPGFVTWIPWCKNVVALEKGSEPLDCPGPQATGMLASVTRQLENSMGDFSPELLADAQSLFSNWAGQEGAWVAHLDLWGVEWPLWDILSKLQRRIDRLRKQDLAGEASALQQVTGFSNSAWRIAMEKLSELPVANVSGAIPEAAPCHSGHHCLGELFVRFYMVLFETGILPLRNANGSLGTRRNILEDVPEFLWTEIKGDLQASTHVDHKKGLDWLTPRNHALQIPRRQLANFLLDSFPLVVGGGRLVQCLEWDEPFFLRELFGGKCEYTNVYSQVARNNGDPAMGTPGSHEYPHGTRHYWGDLEHPEGPGLEHGHFDLIICPFVFEFLSQPFLGMKTLAASLKPGGFLVWAAQSVQVSSEAPHDYFRYTSEGARSLAEYAGLEVQKVYAPGSLQVASGLLLGMLRPYWKDEHVLVDEPLLASRSHPTSVFMLLRAPFALP